MGRKIIAMILAGIVSVLLVTGCSSQSEDQNVSNAGTTQEQQAEPEEEMNAILPSDARIGIAYTQEEGEFTSLFVAKAKGNLVSAGVPEENIETAGAADQELADIAAGMIANGCSVLMVGNADENNAPGITDAAVKADIPVLYFGTSPGEKEISRWKDKDWKIAYVGGAFEQSAAKRAELIDSLGLEKADFDEDGEIGIVVLYTGEGKAGDQVNEETLNNLEELGVSFSILTDDEEEVYSGTDQDESMDQVISWMSDYGKELDLILCADDSQALGAAKAVNDEKKRVGHDVLIMGFDATAESMAEAAAGRIYSTFFNDFMDQSQKASSTVLAFLKGSGADQGFSMISEYVSVTVDNAQEILDIAEKTRESIPEDEDISEEASDEENEAEE